MSRLPLTFACGSCEMAGTFDTAKGTTGLLIVTGGNEIRSGAFGGQASLAQYVAQQGYPVMRFDRRGVGDSEGENRGFENSAKDIAAALAAFKAMAPQITKVIGLGNCDAASALMLAQGAGCDGLILSNPWMIEAGAIEEGGAEDRTDNTPPASAIRARYLARLKNPREVMRLLTGKVDLGKLLRGLGKAVGPSSSGGIEPNSLAARMRDGLAQFEGPVRFLVADNDRTAQVFCENWDPHDARIIHCKGADHAFSADDSQAWFRERLLESLRD
jgi:exosortase A-associated hydrolase 1